MHTKNLETHALKLLRGDRLIWDWEPWKHSTGAKTAKGKAKSSQNARMTPGKKQWRRLCRILGYDYKTTVKIQCPVDAMTARMIFGSKSKGHDIFGGKLTASRSRDFRWSRLEISTTQTYFSNGNGQPLPNNPFHDEKVFYRWLDENPNGIF
jgi:hypothetical protein